jgi:hypothetical protein
MNVDFPTPQPSYSPAFMVQVIEAIRRAFLPVVSKDEAVGRIILQGPDGRSWAVTVDGSGNLVTTVMDGTER